MHAPPRHLPLVFLLGLVVVLWPVGQGSAATPPVSRLAPPIHVPTAADSPAGATEERDLVLLRIALFDNVGLPTEVVAGIRNDAEAVFGQMGVAIEWHEPKWAAHGAGEEREPYYLKVLLTSYEPPSLGLTDAALGAAIGVGFPRDAVWVFDPVIRRVLRGDSRRPRPLDDALIARAYARVLVHEAVHAITARRRHSARGLMTSSLDRDALVGMRIEIDSETINDVRQGIRWVYAADDAG